MIKVAALTSGRNSPPARFRVRQYIEPLKSLGIEVHEHYPIINKYTTKRLGQAALPMRLSGVLAARVSAIAWFERELIPERVSLERFAGKKRLIDIDDAIWINRPSFSERIASLCDGVIAGNEFIAEHYRALGSRVWIIPTSIDTTKWRPEQSVRPSSWTVGWTGSSSNLEFLYDIEEPLADFLADHSAARLLIVCNRKPAFKRIPPRRWQFARWSPGNEVSLAQRMNVGLMPLPDSQWSRGKCALKMIMYMAVGIPSVVSPIGVGRELIDQYNVGLAARTRDDWYARLALFFNERETANRMGLAGRRLVEERFSVGRNALKLAEIFHSIAAEARV